jgi:hypothetical protein
LAERQALLATFRVDYEKWDEYQGILYGVDGGRQYPSSKTFYVDPDLREKALNDVVRLFQEEMGGTDSSDDVKFDDNDEADEDSKMAGIANIDGKSEGVVQSPSQLSLEQLAELLFTPGMRYRGNIRIPGFKDAETETAAAERSSNADESTGTSRRNNTSTTAAEKATKSSPHQTEPERDDTYELIILKRDKDALGNAYILAHHKAYDDEQCVHIKWKIKNDEICVEYEDGETVCKGQWNPTHHRLDGNVCQRLQHNDGAFHTRSAVTHVFTLNPCTYAFPLGRHSSETEHVVVHNTKFWEQPYTGNEKEELAKLRESIKGDDGGSFDADITSLHTRAIVRHRNRTHVFLMKALLGLNDFFVSLGIGHIELLQLRQLLSIFRDESKHPFNDDEIMGMLLKLRRVRWFDLLSAVSIHSEQTSAELRRRSGLLEAEHFDTREQRLDLIERWKETKMDLAGAHTIWNHCEMLGKNIRGLAFAFDHGLIRDSSMFPLQVMRHRLMSNYYCFESAYKRAESRMAICDVTDYAITRNILRLGLEGSDEQNISCPICLHSLLADEDVDDGEEVSETDDIIYKLPCSHCFHSRCVKQWLHNNSSCPVCRADLIKAARQKKMYVDSSVEEA